MKSSRVTLSPTADPELRKQLTYLYSRRSSLDSLIRSLQQYQRFRQKTLVRAAKSA